jgi:hypothetical protein
MKLLGKPWKAAPGGIVGAPHVFTVVAAAPASPEEAALAQLHTWSRREGGCQSPDQVEIVAHRAAGRDVSATGKE